MREPGSLYHADLLKLLSEPMASPSSKPRPQTQKPSGRPLRTTTPASSSPPEVVDPIWLIRAIGLTILAALICGYLTLCLLFYQGQWQLVLHPSRSTPAPLTIAGTPFQTVHFGVDDTASPQLTGWVIPSEPTARYSGYTLLYLPSGDGSLANATSTLSALHLLGVNVFAFDYRGYGQSAPTRPNQNRMTEDAASAWKYLTVSRDIPAAHIVVFGSGVGASLATRLALAHPEVAAVVLELPRPELLQTVLADPRTGSLPVRALFHEDFAVVSPASTLKAPKLFLLPSASASRSRPIDPSATPAALQHLTAVAASPKMVSTLPLEDFNGPLYREQLLRFLDQYLR